jgi:RNA-directed DNA polymerase
MKSLENLKAATTLNDVAKLLGFTPKALSYLLYVKPIGDKYKTFDIPKRTGGTRKICAPCPELMNLQRRLAGCLQNCIDAINKEGKTEGSVLSHGFRPGYSIITNANVHRNRRFVFNVDLENFFGTINFGRVRGFFISNRNFELPPKVATIIAQIACHDNALPQGSPCSPVISNLLGHLLDIRLASIAHKQGCTYSRYADDLTFSTNKSAFPAAIAVPAKSIDHEWDVGSSVLKAIHQNGFTVNSKKTRMQYDGSRQEVTGLVVNARINTRYEYRRKARAMVYRLRATGSFQRDVADKKKDGTLDELNGILSFIDAVEVFDKKKDLPPSQKVLPLPFSKEARGPNGVFRDFLFYRHFFASPYPVIACEGKTDNIYIRAAIKSLVGAYPDLAKVDGTGKLQMLVSLFRRTKTTDRLLGLPGGSDQLVTLIKQYLFESKRVAISKSTQPVILLIDNDDGAKGVYSYVGKVIGKPVDKTAPFIRVSNKFYVVPTPLLPVGKSMIEDFFDGGVLGMKLDGKTFNPKNEDLDHKSEYGKAYFALHVVKKLEATIDFKGFKPILDRLVAALDDHRVKNL